MSLSLYWSLSYYWFFFAALRVDFFVLVTFSTNTFSNHLLLVILLITFSKEIYKKNKIFYYFDLVYFTRFLKHILR